MNDPTLGEVLDEKLKQQTIKADELESRIRQLEMLALAHQWIPLDGHPESTVAPVDTGNDSRNGSRDSGNQGASP